MRRYLLSTILFLAAACLLVTGCGLKNNSLTNSGLPSEKKVDTSRAEQKYENDLKTILQPYWQSQQPVGIKDQILALKVPAKYSNLHLNLVIAFELLEQGKAKSDQTKINSGNHKLNKLVSEYSWLK
jgi:hypothetical protein